MQIREINTKRLCARVQTVNYRSRTTKRNCCGCEGEVQAGGASAAIYVNTQRERRNLILIFPFCFYISLICALACVRTCVRMYV